MKILNGEKSRVKSFIGGIVIGGVIGLLSGGFVVAVIMAQAILQLI